MREAPQGGEHHARLFVPLPTRVALSVAVVLILFLGIFPGSTMRFAADSIAGLPADSIRSAPDFYAEAVARLPADASPDVQEILRLLLIQHIEFTYQLNAPATETDRQVAARAVSTTKRSFIQGEAIVGHDRSFNNGLMSINSASVGSSSGNVGSLFPLRVCASLTFSRFTASK